MDSLPLMSSKWPNLGLQGNTVEDKCTGIFNATSYSWTRLICFPPVYQRPSCSVSRPNKEIPQDQSLLNHATLYPPSIHFPNDLLK